MKTFEYSYVVNDVYDFWRNFAGGFYFKNFSLREFKTLLKKRGKYQVITGKKVIHPNGECIYYIPVPEN